MSEEELIEKRKERRKITGEDFTPVELVNKILDEFPLDVWKDPSKTWLDPAAGNGNFLVEVKKRLLGSGHSEKHIMENMLYGVELMQDNVDEMVERLNAKNFKHNIVCEDFFVWHDKQTSNSMSDLW